MGHRLEMRMESPWTTCSTIPQRMMVTFSKLPLSHRQEEASESWERQPRRERAGGDRELWICSLITLMSNWVDKPGSVKYDRRMAAVPSTSTHCSVYFELYHFFHRIIQLYT